MQKIIFVVVIILTLAVILFIHPAHAADSQPQVYMEEMTWPEIKERMVQGATTVIIPTGGTEQNGPALPLGKHNFVVDYTSGQIARKLGNALVAPVLAYVPEGRIDPPEGHMRFPGTISLSDETFAAVLEDTARSMKEHGFRLICFLGDHGGSQAPQKEVADKLNAEWEGLGARVLQVSDYYSNNGQDAWVKSRGINVSNPDAHGGFFDASETLALRPDLVKKKLLAAYTEANYPTTGAAGDSTAATAAYGRKLLSLKINAAVAQIRNAESR